MISKNAVAVIEEANKILPARANDTAFNLSEKASKLLLVTAKLAHERRTCEHALLRASSVEKAEYAKAFSEAEAKTAKEREIKADASEKVLEAKEFVAELKSDITYITTHIDIYRNAHLLYRQELRQEKEEY